ncbi:type I-E CRISPR-associated protein Cas6/Cse3/CasE [Nesterenkonia suensis]
MTTWITEIILNNASARLPKDTHKMHRILAKATDGPHHLWANPRPGTLIVQSPSPLRRDVLTNDAHQIRSSPIDRDFTPGDQLTLTGIISPRKSARPPSTRQRGKKTFLTVEETPAWIIRHLQDAATLRDIDVQQLPPSHGTKPNGTRIVYGRRAFTAHATVRSPEALAHALDHGIGPGKRFGSGLILGRKTT